MPTSRAATPCAKLIDAALREALRPELLNRIADVVCFESLGREATRGVLSKALVALKSRLVALRIRLEVSEAALGVMERAGTSEELGAREIERKVEKLLVRPLAEWILERHLSAPAIVRVSEDSGKLVFASEEHHERQAARCTACAFEGEGGRDGYR